MIESTAVDLNIKQILEHFDDFFQATAEKMFLIGKLFFITCEKYSATDASIYMHAV